ncbi:MAG TPA: NfeD family protein [bacterium]|nr:NfeD family protein [bacterium]HPS29776.1 NfeD family protein [bacterium]
MEFFGMDPWIMWGVIAVVCIIIEIFLPSFWMAILSIGAVGASIASVTGAGLGIQLAVFSAISVIAGIFFRPFALKYIYRNSESKPSNVDALIGRKVPVVVNISAENPGKVKIGSEVWKAIPAKEGDNFNAGEFVIISSIDGSKVIVKSSEPVA